MNNKLFITTKQTKPVGNTDIKIISFPEMQFILSKKKKSTIGSNERSNTASMQFKYNLF